MAKQRVSKRHQFTDAAKGANQFRQALVKFRSALDERRELWDRLTPEQWARVEAIDPVLQLARQMHDELKGWFDG